MKKLLLVLVLSLALFLCGGAQEIKIKSPIPMSFTSEQEAVGKAKATTNYVIVKGVKHTVYTSTRGSFYYVILNSKGLYSRKYFKQ